MCQTVPLNLAFFSSWLLLVTITGPVAWAVQEIAVPPIPPRVERIELVVTPADEPRGALKYQLLPSLEQRKPGNAVSFYYRTIMLYQQVGEHVHQQYDENKKSWVLSNDEMPLDEMKQYVAAYGFALGELQEAVYRERCDWDFQLNRLHGTDGIGFLLPELQLMRNIARVLVIKARIAIAERRFDDAIETLRHGYQMARDAARPKTLVNALVGIAICQYMNEVVEDLINTPGSPNLYWAVASLPRPLIDMRAAFEQEMTLPMRMFPLLRDPENANRSADQWHQLFVDAVKILQGLGDGEKRKDHVAALAEQLMTKAFPAAKQELLEAGYDEQTLSSMSRGQILAIKAAHDHRYITDEFFKWTRLPHQLSARRLSQVEAKLKKAGYFGAADSREVLPIASMLLPSIEAASMAQARLDQRIAMLQTIEAIRIYAAKNRVEVPMGEPTGKLPGSLDELDTHPAPVNPIDGRQFPFESTGDKIEVWYSSMRGNQTSEVRQYSITLNK